MNGWLGTDYFKSKIDGAKIFGSIVQSENDTEFITLHLKRDNTVLFRSGPRSSGQYVLINNGGIGRYYSNLPVSIEWIMMKFDNLSLPESFDVTFIDAGTGWGEWSAIALVEHD